MKWIKCSDRLPELERIQFLAFSEGKIYLGTIASIISSSYSCDGKYTLISSEKKTTFYVDMPYEKSNCGDCSGDPEKQCGGQCVECCEEDHAIDQKQLAFNIAKIEYWMPLPEGPKDV